MLKITREVYNGMIEHSKELAPIEACGCLAELDGVVSIQRKMTNVDNSPEHFSFDMKEYFAVTKELRQQKAKIVVTYHSHPESPSRPSEEDKKLLNDPNQSYVIVSLMDETPVVKSFKINGTEVTEEPIEIVD